MSEEQELTGNKVYQDGVTQQLAFMCVSVEILRGEHLLEPTRMTTDVHAVLRHESSAAVFTLGIL